MLYIIIGCVAAYVFLQICNWRVYIKMGEPGWVGLIPVWRIFVLFWRAWSEWAPLYFFLPAIIGGTLLVIDHWIAWLAAYSLLMIAVEMYCIAIVKLAKGTGHSTWFGIGLLVLPLIFYPILAFTN